MKRLVFFILALASIKCYSVKLEIVDVKMMTHPTELIYLWINDKDSNHTSLYVLDYFEYDENPSPYDIVRIFKPINLRE